MVKGTALKDLSMMKKKTSASQDELYMRRCFDLARLGAGRVSPNPMVGAVLVHEGLIIGEGYHQKYGTAHAEVNALKSVNANHQHLISKSTLYVSLEPCCIFGKTPPCTNLILQHKIPAVVISCLDQTPEVAGKGVQILEDAGIVVKTGVLEKEGRWLSRFRNTFATKNRPYIILKYAQSRDGYMGAIGKQIWISNEYSKRWVHQLRAETDAILVGTNTAKTDNPKLNNRLYFGSSPLRIVLDRHLSLSTSLQIFDQQYRTWIINELKNEIPGKNLELIKIPFDDNLLPNLMNYLAKQKITSLLVEGGPTTLSSFIKKNLWEEAYVIESAQLIHQGLKSPDLNRPFIDKRQIGADTLTVHINTDT